MGRPITISINVSKIDKQYIYEGKSGKYLNIAVFENRDGPDKYGNTHYCVQDLPKEARDQGVKGAIIGNAKFPDASDAPARRGNGDRFSRPPERQPSRDYKMAGRRTDDSGPGEVDF